MSTENNEFTDNRIHIDQDGTSTYLSSQQKTNRHEEIAAEFQEKMGYRTIVLRSPVTSQTSKLEPAPRRATCGVSPKTEVITNGVIPTVKINKATLLSIVVIPFISYYIYTSLYSPNSDTCDMNKLKIEISTVFMVLVNIKNHFSTSIADECNCNVTFDAVLPQTVLKSDNSASSFMILAKYGTGKTLLRCEYFEH